MPARNADSSSTWSFRAIAFAANPVPMVCFQKASRSRRPLSLSPPKRSNTCTVMTRFAISSRPSKVTARFREATRLEKPKEGELTSLKTRASKPMSRLKVIRDFLARGVLALGELDDLRVCCRECGQSVDGAHPWSRTGLPGRPLPTRGWRLHWTSFLLGTVYLSEETDAMRVRISLGRKGLAR